MPRMFTDYGIARNSHGLHINFGIHRATSYSANGQVIIPVQLTDLGAKVPYIDKFAPYCAIHKTWQGFTAIQDQGIVENRRRR